MTDEKPPMPPGLPPMPPMPPMPPADAPVDAPPAPPGMPPMPPMPPMDAPPAPPEMPPMPPMDAPPAPPEMPPMPPMDAPPAPPEMPPMPPMDAPPAPPEMPPMPPMDAPPAPPEMPPMPPMDAPPAPPEMPPMPPMDAPPAPPEMPPMPPMDAPPAPPEMPAADALLAPPAPPEMPPMPPMDAPPAPPEMPPMPPMDAPPAPPEMAAADALLAPPSPPEMPPMPPMDAPPAPPEMAAADALLAPPAPPEMPPMDAPPAPPEMAAADALLAPPAPPEMPPMDAPPAPPEMAAADALLAPPAPPEMPPMDAPSADSLLAPPAPPTDPLLTPVGSDGTVTEDIAAEDSEAEQDGLTPDDLSGEQAGATIRSRAEVDEVPGDKLEGTLHEIEDSVLNCDGEVVKQSVKGTLTINNPSADDRIYDIDVILDNADSTDIGGDHVSVDELEAGKKYSMKYKVEGKRMMALRERLDTNPARSQERSLSVSYGPEGGPLALELEVENLSAVSLENVVVSRPVPKEIHFENTGTAQIDGNSLTWEVGTLAPGEKQVLAIEGKITVTNTKTINAGVATATYTAESTLSDLNFRELDAFCRGFTYMRVVEDERPDNWICKTIFENRSSFAVDLVKLQVRMKGSNELLFDIHDVDQDVHPNGKWESDEKTVVATSEPDFTYDLSYTILPRATRSTEGTMKLEEKKFDVLDAEVEKEYSTTGLRSYRNQKITSTITLSNKGSSTINLMRLTDDIPGLFDAPEMDSLRISIGGKDLEPEQYKAEVSSGITLEKEHRSPDGDGHTLTMTIGTRGPLGLKPKDKIVMTYDLVAPDPSPDNKKVVAPMRAEFSAERFGPVCGRDCDSPPSIKVIHHRRNFSAGKQAIPLGGKGRYEVLILFENNGDTALQDVYINDVIPSNFDIKDWYVKGADGKRQDCEMVTEDHEDGTHISWHVPVVGKNERIEVSFEIKGTGEVDAEALNRFHGVHFGDEVETEDVPELESGDQETDAEISSDEVSDDSEEETPKVTWREDVLLRVMESSGISVEDRDAFVAHAVNFDHDDNGYLKKAELEDAAKAWIEGQSNNDESESVEESLAEEATEGEAANNEESSEDKPCPICSTMNHANSETCISCGYTYE